MLFGRICRILITCLLDSVLRRNSVLIIHGSLNPCRKLLKSMWQLMQDRYPTKPCDKSALEVGDWHFYSLLWCKEREMLIFSLNFFSFRNLLSLRKYSGNVEEMVLTFTVANNDLGESQVIRVVIFYIILYSPETPLSFPPSKFKYDAGLPHPPPPSLLPMPLRPLFLVALQVVELKPGGRDIPVTNDNIIDYIQLMADYRLNKQVSPRNPSFLLVHLILLQKQWLVLHPYVLWCYFTLGLILTNLKY